MKRFLSWLFYYANMVWVKALLMAVTSRDIQGRENVPRKGPLILASNHLSNGDPPILTAATPRQIAWLTKAEWFKTPIIGAMFRMGGMLPVRRFEADLQALRRVQELLKRGGCLGMFPEGTRSLDGVLHKGEPGSALVALRTGAPIQPVAIWGTEHVKLPRDLFRRTRAHVTYGKPFRLPQPKRIRREDVEAGTDAIMRSIAELLPEQYRGAYAEGAKEQPATSMSAASTE